MGELTPYICVADARRAIDWYVDVLGAEVVVEPIVMDDGRIGHVELAVGGGRWMMSDEFASAGVAAPDTVPRRRPSRCTSRSTTSTRCARGSIADGVTLDRGPEDNPPVGRVAVFRDPFGHRWFLNQPLD